MRRGTLHLVPPEVAAFGKKKPRVVLTETTRAFPKTTGTKKSADTMLDVLRREGVTRLDGVILTHTHADHTGGLKALLASDIAVDRIYASRYYVLKKEDIVTMPAVLAKALINRGMARLVTA